MEEKTKEIPLSDLLTNNKYRELSLDKLAEIINYHLSSSDYDELDGFWAKDKAKKLIEKWENEPDPTQLADPLMKWNDVDDKPLFTKDDKGNWECTQDGEGEFIAAVPYKDSRKPDEEMWWVRHCIIMDDIGLCVFTDDVPEPAGWSMEDVRYWTRMPNVNNLKWK
jgi:hypothetical protein